jgi:hypothetical protein
MPKHHYDAMLPFLLELAEAHDIRHPQHFYQPKSTATAVLETIGLGYLSPKHPCPPCEKPAAKPKPGRRRREAGFSLVF